MPVFDAAFLIDAKRHPEERARVLERLEELPEAFLVPAQAAIEYAAGIDPPDHGFADLEASFEVVPCDAVVARQAALIAQDAFRRGVFPGWADVQVAATARVSSTFVVTPNVRHLRDGCGVPVWDYTREADPPTLPP